VICISLAWVSFDVAAQYAIGDGTGLDNNLQAGSGGRNPASVQPDFRLRNEIITGNVTGLGYFHGNIGYGSSSDFRGNLGSDDLYRFRATSVGVAQATRGGTTSSLRYLPRPYAADSPTSLAIRSRLDRAASVGFDVNDARLSSGLIRTSDRASSYGYARDRSGRLLELEATPLLGVRSKGTRPTDLDEKVAARVDASSDSVAVQQALGAGVRPLVDTSSLAIGAAVRGQLSSQRADDVKTMDEQLSQIEARMFSPLGSRQVKPGEDVVKIPAIPHQG